MMEYVASNNPGMAQQYFTSAHKVCPDDPAVMHELGVIAFRVADYSKAERYFEAALALICLVLFQLVDIQRGMESTSGGRSFLV